MEKTPGTHTAVFKAHLDVEGLITGVEYFEDKRLIVLSGYSNVVRTFLLNPFVYLLYDYQGDDFFGGNKRKININNLSYHQVEGIASKNGLQYYITNEKFSQSIITRTQKLHLLNLAPYLEHYLTDPCYRLPADGPALNSSFGITTKSSNTYNTENGWPENVPNGYLVLDSNSKGLVISHLNNQQRDELTPVEGMLIYNTDEGCAQLYRGTVPTVDSERNEWQCLEPGCPE